LIKVFVYAIITYTGSRNKIKIEIKKKIKIRRMTMDKYFNMLKERGADFVSAIDADSVVTAPWVTYKCQFGCSSYGKNNCCPPFTPTYNATREILRSYRKGILFRMHHLKDVTPSAVQIAREMFLDGYYKVIAFGAGCCQKCANCSIGNCKFPGQTVPSMEACGIDVFATVRKNGVEIHTLREKGQLKNCFGLILFE